jgi:hypothetical protein
MPASHVAVRTEHGIDGLILAPSTGNRGQPFGPLRAGMAELRRGGREPRTAFVLVISGAGRIVPGRSSEAAVFVLAYRVTP